MKGACGIDGSKGEDFLNRGREDGQKPVHDLSLKFGDEFKRACDPWEEKTWKPGPVSSAVDQRHETFDTHPATPYSPSGKYAKKGGSGQRSGS